MINGTIGTCIYKGNFSLVILTPQTIMTFANYIYTAFGLFGIILGATILLF